MVANAIVAQVLLADREQLVNNQRSPAANDQAVAPNDNDNHASVPTI